MIPDFGPPPARERYVPNDIGPSPDAWLAPRLEQVSTLITNGFVGTATPFYTDYTGVKYLYGQNVRENYVDEASIRYITKSFHNDQSKTRLRSGDILTVQSGHIGVTAVVPPSLDGVNCHALIVTRLRKEYANPDFVSQYLNSEIGKARMRGLEVGSTILHINTKDLKKFRIPLPTLAEQERIVDFLKTWDRAIETVEALIANARAQKQALMQQLLPQGTTPPKKRLPGFSGEWRQTTLEGLARVVMGSSPPSSAYNENQKGLPLIQGNADTHNRRSQPRTYTSEITQICEPDDILFSVRAPVGEISVSCHHACIGRGIAAIRPRFKDDFDFLYFRLLAAEPTWARLSQGSIFQAVNSKDLKGFVIMAPSDASERLAIGEALRKCQLAENCLQAQLTALRKEKAALMQQLLTGKRRVKLPKSEVA